MTEIVPPSDSARQFHEKEFIALRDELLALFRDQRFFERAAVIGPVAAYSWLVAHGSGFREEPMHLVAWWLPPILMLFLFREERKGKPCG